MRAATIAKATGADSTRVKETHRLGSLSSRAEANTYETFATAYVERDGSGYIEVKRRSNTFHFTFGPETGELPMPSTEPRHVIEDHIRRLVGIDILQSYIEGDE